MCVKSSSKRRAVPCIELYVTILIQTAHMELLSGQNVPTPAAAGGSLTGPHEGTTVLACLTRR